MFYFLEILALLRLTRSSAALFLSFHTLPLGSVGICLLIGKIYQPEPQAPAVPQHIFPSETSPSSYIGLSFLILSSFELGIHGADGEDKAAAESVVPSREAQCIDRANEATRLDPLAN